MTPTNHDSAYSDLGPCEDREFELMEYADGALPAASMPALRAHLDGCARCRAFLREWTAVDASLAAAVTPVALSAGFEDRLRERIEEVSRTVSKRAALEQEERHYAQLMQALRRGLSWRTALNAVAAGSVCGGVLTAMSSLVPDLLASLHVQLPALATAELAVGAVAVIGGFVATQLLRRPVAASLLG